MSDSAAPRLAVRGRRTVTLRDGSRVTLREIAPSDKPLLAASFERLSPESRYRRFFTAKTRLSEAELDYLVNIDHNDHEAVVAIDPATGDVVGVARYIPLRAEAGTPGPRSRSRWPTTGRGAASGVPCSGA